MSCIEERPDGTVVLKPYGWYSPGDILPTIPTRWASITAQIFRGAPVNYCPGIFEHSLRTLAPTKRINDEVINVYLDLLESEFTICTTRFLSVLRLLHSGSKDSTLPPKERTISYESLQDMGQIFIPVHDEENAHWSFLRLLPLQDPWTNTPFISVEHYDSSDCVPCPDLTALDQCFPGIPHFVSSMPSPIQWNYIDCGLFVMMGIRLMSSGSELFTQDEANHIIPHCRSRVLSELLAGKMDPTFSDCDLFEAQNLAARDEPGIQTTSYHKVGGNSELSPVNLDTPMLLQLASRHSPDSPVTPRPSPSIKRNVGVVKSQKSKRATSSKLVQRTLTCGLVKRPKPLQLDDVALMVQSFGSKDSIIEMLKFGVSEARTRTNIEQASKGAVERALLIALYHQISQSDVPHQPLFRRDARQRFSQKFFATFETLKTRNRGSVSLAKAELENILGCDRKFLEAMLNRANHGTIWTTILQRVDRSLGFVTRVGLCASPEAISKIETLTGAQGKFYVEGIEARLSAWDDDLLATLRHAYPLCDAIFAGNLPPHLIAIECQVHQKDMTFEQLVSLEPLPDKLPLLSTKRWLRSEL